MHESFIFPIIVGAIFIGIVVFSLLPDYGIKKLKKQPAKKISDCQSGEVVKVVGEVKYIGKPLIAPLSGRPCVYYHVLVEIEGNTRVKVGSISYDSNFHWETFIEEETGSDLMIKDGRDYAFIEKSLVQSFIMSDKRYSSGFHENATPELEKYLEQHGKKSTDWLGMNKKLRYKEGVLEEGEKIAVIGKAAWKRKSELNQDVPSERILVIGSDTNHEEPVYLSDDPTTLN